MDNRPEWVHCIRHTSLDMKDRNWCGRDATGWDFLGADHAAENGNHKGRLVACRQCVAAIFSALCNGHDDAEYQEE